MPEQKDSWGTVGLRNSFQPFVRGFLTFRTHVSTLGAGFLTNQKPQRCSGRVGPLPALPVLPAAVGGALGGSGHQVGRQRGLLDFPLLAFKLLSKPLRKVFPEHFAEKKINQKFENEKTSLNTLITVLP